MQYDVFRVYRCHNKEKHKLLAVFTESFGGQSTSRARHGAGKVGGASTSTSFRSVRFG